MEKLQITPGKWEQNGINAVHSGSTCVAITDNKEFRKADAILIADAGNTYRQCSTIPSELLRQNQEMKEALERIEHETDSLEISHIVRDCLTSLNKDKE